MTTYCFKHFSSNLVYEIYVVNKKCCEFKKEAYKKKGGQDRDGIHEAWLMNRFEHADTPIEVLPK